MENLNIPTLSDLDLLETCKKYGLRARRWKKRFAGLLPEVMRRRLYEKKNCASIIEFASKFGGISKNYALRVLSVHRALEGLPKLQQLLESGTVSVHILSRVVSVATQENESFLVEQVKNLPKSALETLVRDMKYTQNKNQNDFQKPLFDPESVPGHKPQFHHDSGDLQLDEISGLTTPPTQGEIMPGHTLEVPDSETRGRQNSATSFASLTFGSPDLHFDEDVRLQLLELQNRGININQLLREFLKQREQKITEEKEKIAAATKPTNSRYIPATVRKILKQEYGNKCSISHCHKPAAEIHHTQRFSIAKTHDPYYLAPLCREHHVIAHNVDRRFLEKRKR